MTLYTRPVPSMSFHSSLLGALGNGTNPSPGFIVIWVVIAIAVIVVAAVRVIRSRRR